MFEKHHLPLPLHPVHRQDLVTRLLKTGGFDPTLREMVWRTLGPDMLSDNALKILANLLEALGVENGNDHDARHSTARQVDNPQRRH